MRIINIGVPTAQTVRVRAEKGVTIQRRNCEDGVPLPESDFYLQKNPQ